VNTLYKKILVPLDGSELAQLALPFAEKIAGQLGSHVMLIYVGQSSEDSRNPERQLYLEKIATDLKAGVKRRIGKLKRKRINVKSEILTGDAAAEIIDYANNSETDLIIMSTHGRSGLERWALGSVADKVLRGTDKPLILVRARTVSPEISSESVLRKIVLALDGSKDSEAVIPYVEDLALGINAEVVLIHVIEPSYSFYTIGGLKYQGYSERKKKTMKAFYNSYLKGIATRFANRGIDTRHQVLFGDVTEAIVDFADKTRADLVAMTTHGRSGVKRWVLGSTAARILQIGSTSLFLVRAPGARTQ
jgi:nucleotide-binding universal stress UspA family protein